MGEWLSLLRVHQWYKNLLCLVVLFIHPELMRLDALWLFLSLCIASSTVYLFNDIMDQQADQGRDDRRHRPLASGVISIPDAIAALPVLGAAAVMLWPAGVSYCWLLIYWAINLAYNLIIKKQMGYGLSTAITVLACHLVRVMPFVAIDGQTTSHEAMLIIALGLVIFPLVTWKQRSYLFGNRIVQSILKGGGMLGIAVLTVCLHPYIGNASYACWLIATVLYVRIMQARNTREPYQAIFG